MTKNINQRLRQVDRRIAKITRSLGFLEARLFFLAYGNSEWEEVSIFSFTDNGISGDSLPTGEDFESHTFSCTIDRDWLDAHYQIQGEWAVIIPPGTEKILAQKDGETVNGMDTFGSLSFRIINAIGLPAGIESIGKTGSNNPRYSR